MIENVTDSGTNRVLGAFQSSKHLHSFLELHLQSFTLTCAVVNCRPEILVNMY